MSGRHRQAADAGEPTTASTPAPTRPGRSRMTLAALVAAALCVPAAAAVVILGLRDRTAEATDDARAAAVTAARSDVEDLLSYDYRSLDEDMARAKTESTGVFAAQYAQTAQRLAQEAKATHAIVQATASNPGVVSATEDQVVVLLFVDQASVKLLTGATSPTTRIDQSRVQVTMTKVGGRWLVSQLAAL